ncbi:MAG: MFS transporter [Planctomycetota bacterium]
MPAKDPSGSAPDAPEPTWKRTYWVVWAANLVTSIGMMSFLPFFPSLLLEMGVTDDGARSAWAGVCFAAAPLSATVSAPLWGAVGDRFGRKIMVCRAMFAIALFVSAMGFAQSPWQLLALRLGQGMFSGFIPPSITLVSIAAPSDMQGRVAGNLSTALAIGGLTGPLFGGFLKNLFGAQRPVFFVVGALALAAGLLVWFGAREDVTKRRAGSKPTGRAALRQTVDDVREVFRSSAMRATALVVFALQFGLGAVNPVLELHVEGLFGSGLEGSFWERIVGWTGAQGATLEESVETLATSLLFGAMAIANLLSLSWWGRYGDRIGHRPALLRCGIVSLASLVVQGLAPGYAVLLLGRFLMGVGMAGIGPLAFGLAAGEASADRRGGAFGVVFSARTFAAAVGGMSGGVLFDLVRLEGVLLLGSLLLVFALVGFRRSSARASGPAARPRGV